MMIRANRILSLLSAYASIAAISTPSGTLIRARMMLLR